MVPFVVVFAFGACFFLDDTCGGDTMFGLLPFAFAAVFFFQVLIMKLFVMEVFTVAY